MADFKKLADLGLRPLEGTTYRDDFAFAINEKRKLVENRNGYDQADYEYFKRLWAETFEPRLIKSYETAAREQREDLEKGAHNLPAEKISKVSKMLDEFEADLERLKKRLAKISCEYNITFH